MSEQQIRWPSVPLLSQRQLPHKADLVRVGRSYDAPQARASSQSDQPTSWLTSTARRCSQRWSEDLGSPCRRTGLAVRTPRPTETLGPVRCDARASSRPYERNQPTRTERSNERPSDKSSRGARTGPCPTGSPVRSRRRRVGSPGYAVHWRPAPHTPAAHRRTRVPHRTQTRLVGPPLVLSRCHATDRPYAKQLEITQLRHAPQGQPR